MPQLFYYLLKVIACSAILFGYYHLFLRNKVYHAYNRFYLLATLVLSLTVPLLNFNITTGGAVAQPRSIQVLEVVNSSDAFLEETIIRSHRNHVSSSEALVWGYVLVSIIFLLLFIQVIARIAMLIRKSDKHRINDIIFISSTAKGTPFSFFRYLFWNRNIDINTETGSHVFAHELAHIKEKHSFDKLALNFLLVLFWINPVFWRMRRELNLIHEFIADKRAVGDHDTQVLANMILQTAYPQHNFLLTNHFFYSPIKRRLQMLSKYKTTKAGYLTRILALPVILFLAAAFTLKTKKMTEPHLYADRQITVVIDAGHGGTDNGAKAIDGSFEKDINLLLAQKVQAMNSNTNIKIVMTRDADIYMNPKEKAAFAVNAGADLFISIHASSEPWQNAGRSSGMEVLVAKDKYANSSTSKLFASAIIDAFRGNYKPGIKPYPQQKETGIWILQETKCPAVLIEAGYLSNTSDLAYLRSEPGKAAFAKNILAAINNYLTGTAAPGKAPSDTVPVKAATANATLVNGSNNDEPTAIMEATEFVIEQGDNHKENGIIVINEKVYKISELNNKKILAKKAYTYGPGNNTMIKKYGEAAREGVLLFENAQILAVPAKTYAVILKKESNNPEADASEWSFEPESESRRSTIHVDSAVNLTFRDNPGKQPLYAVDGKITGKTDVLKLKPADISSIIVLKGKEAIDKYGAKSKEGVVEIWLKAPNNSPVSIE
jgi:N-acetylmuramoyl-L-alanine amidase